LLESRQQAGQALSADLARTAVQEASARADVIDSEARRDAAAMGLNNLMGRPPGNPFEPVPLPEPPPPPTVPAAEAPTTPDIEAARFEREAAAAALDVARAEPRPHLDLHADAGLWGSDTSHAVPPDFAALHPDATFADRLRRDLGYSVSVFVTWPLTDFGGIHARIAQARLALEQAGQAEKATTMEKDLEAAQAHRAMEHAYRQFQDLGRAMPQAHDAVLEAESRYWGGAGTTLEVLDAFTAATDLAVRRVQAELTYRLAEALALRWEGQP
jgi:outer membrane protein TolC